MSKEKKTAVKGCLASEVSERFGLVGERKHQQQERRPKKENARELFVDNSPERRWAKGILSDKKWIGWVS